MTSLPNVTRRRKVKTSLVSLIKEEASPADKHVIQLLEKAVTKSFELQKAI